MSKNRGSDLDAFLREEGLLEEVEASAAKRWIAHELGQIMAREKLSKAALAKRMGASRSEVDPPGPQQRIGDAGEGGRRGWPASHSLAEPPPGSLTELTVPKELLAGTLTQLLRWDLQD